MGFPDFAQRLVRSMSGRGMRALLSGGSPRAPRGTVRHASKPRTLNRHIATPHPYLGDWAGPLPRDIAWHPQDDGRPDPGEVVWSWVPYEEDHTQGKDRPSLVIARHPERADVVLALPLTSKDHDRDAAQEARAGRHWMDVGTGPWDRSGRASEARLDRVLQLEVTAIRREGAAIDRAIFEAVVEAARRCV